MHVHIIYYSQNHHSQRRQCKQRHQQANRNRWLKLLYLSLMRNSLKRTELPITERFVAVPWTSLLFFNSGWAVMNVVIFYNWQLLKTVVCEILTVLPAMYFGVQSKLLSSINIHVDKTVITLHDFMYIFSVSN